MLPPSWRPTSSVRLRLLLALQPLGGALQAGACPIGERKDLMKQPIW